jgi:hypothetical protein
MVYSAAKFQQSNTYQYPTEKSAETFWSTYVAYIPFSDEIRKSFWFRRVVCVSNISNSEPSKRLVRNLSWMLCHWKTTQCRKFRFPTSSNNNMMKERSCKAGDTSTIGWDSEMVYGNTYALVKHATFVNKITNGLSVKLYSFRQNLLMPTSVTCFGSGRGHYQVKAYKHMRR